MKTTTQMYTNSNGVSMTRVWSNGFMSEVPTVKSQVRSVGDKLKPFKLDLDLDEGRQQQIGRRRLY